VLTVASVLILVQGVYRGWASVHAWWQGDDLLFISRVFSPGGTSLEGLLGSYVSHMLPGALYLTWLINKLSPYNYAWAAAFLIVMQLLAGIGLLRLLLVAFGRRWGIVAPLVLFLTTSFTAQCSVWWANGVQALPLFVSFSWALGSQVRYLQTGRNRHALAAILWIVFGLLFFEKALLVIGALAIVTVAYFTEGSIRARVATLWREYRFSLVGNALVGLVYLPLYVHFALDFRPDSAATYPIGPTADVIMLRTWPTGIFGGPLRWAYLADGQVNYAAPSGPLVLACLVALILVIRTIARARTRSMRALLLPAFFLLSDTLLVVAGRGFAFGALIGYEFRYISELAVVTAVALALATMPIIGAPQAVEKRAGTLLLDNWRVAGAICAAIAILGTISTTIYYDHWRIWRVNKSYFTTLIDDVRQAPPGTAVVDSPVPTALLWAYGYPENTLSHLLEPVPHHLDFTQVATDHLAISAPDGHLAQLQVTPVHRSLPGSAPDCGYRIGRGMTTIPLEGPFVFGGWWVRLGYLATAPSTLTVRAGGAEFRTSVEAGFHALYVAAGDEDFDSISVGGLVGEVEMCTDDVTVGRAHATGYPETAP
jgi:hypothetical protein